MVHRSEVHHPMGRCPPRAGSRCRRRGPTTSCPLTCTEGTAAGFNDLQAALAFVATPRVTSNACRPQPESTLTLTVPTRKAYSDHLWRPSRQKRRRLSIPESQAMVGMPVSLQADLSRNTPERIAQYGARPTACCNTIAKPYELDISPARSRTRTLHAARPHSAMNGGQYRPLARLTTERTESESERQTKGGEIA